MRPVHVVSLIGVVIGAMVAAERPRAAQRASDPTVSELLAAAGRYVADYETTFGAVIAEERYQQSDGARAYRVTVGDMLLFNAGGAGWMAFRDVRMVDSVQLSTPASRLVALVANPTHDALADAMRASAASATYTISDISRAPLIPTTALMYLRPTRQSIGAFTLEGMKTVSNIRVAVLAFAERPHARMTAADDSITTGHFWIDPETGRVVQTELTITSGGYENRTDVQYASRPGIDVWVPVRAFEQYHIALPVRADGLARGGGSPTVYADGLATYQSFRRFELKPGLVNK